MELQGCSWIGAYFINPFYNYLTAFQTSLSFDFGCNVTQEEQEVTLCAKENFGIYNGISIPVSYGQYAIAGISIITKSSDIVAFRKNILSSIEQITSLALLHNQKVLSSKTDLHFFIQPLLATFTEKKKMVLKQLISGKSLIDIQHHYPISRRYAEKLLLQIKKEFGDISTNELLYILGTAQLLEYL